MIAEVISCSALEETGSKGRVIELCFGVVKILYSQHLDSLVAFNYDAVCAYLALVLVLVAVSIGRVLDHINELECYVVIVD